MRVASSTESLVQLLQHRQRIRIVVRGGAERTDDQGYQHPGLQSFSGDVAGDDQHAAVGGVSQDLKEISSDLACGAVLAFNAESGNVRERLRNQELLHRLGLEYILHHGLLPPLRAAEMTQEQEGEAHQHAAFSDQGQVHADSSRRPRGINMQPPQAGIKHVKVMEEDGQKGQPTIPRSMPPAKEDDYKQQQKRCAHSDGERGRKEVAG